MRDLWLGLPVMAQDSMILTALLVPVAVIAVVLLRRFAPYVMVRALLRRHLAINAVFVGLIAMSVAIGCGLIAQERGLRRASAQATDKFDLIVGAPGSEVTLLFSAVYLQPADIGLVDGEAFAEIAANPRVALAAPIAFGDSWPGHPAVGTVPELIAHLSPQLAQGHGFATYQQAVIGASVTLSLGDYIAPAHGVGQLAEQGAHGGHEIAIIGQMAPTGTPWDNAILMPIEGLWQVDGLGDGAGGVAAPLMGGPFDAAHFLGATAVLVIPTEPDATDSLRQQFTRDDMMAILPGAVSSQLHGLMGDIRGAVSLLTVVSQGLVAIAVLAGLTLLIRLFARQLALLHALGAPLRFVSAVIWSYAMGLVLLGSVIGLILSLGVTSALSSMIEIRTGLSMTADIGWAEIRLTAAFILAAAIAAVLPALFGLRGDIARRVRG
ncbi:putative ABC transport system permease protein [Monaibacterium marinum]|uniref:Putative ABC transport system permease protein n=1 Tax=Pontivivens marinum TaxID=1690039 RepID=A0A2C9CNN4_9RHOB|nr:hypothetical protein [Monaibacterium marinum]SOH93141.1 putative ABC transport system permease protein [Monaibacterium marinum]